MGVQGCSLSGITGLSSDKKSGIYRAKLISITASTFLMLTTSPYSDENWVNLRF